MPEKSRVTLADIAHSVGVTKMTVSNVINNRPGVSEETRRKVLEAIVEHDYVANVAARGLAGGRTNLIGVVVPRLGWPYVSEVVVGASIAAEAVGFDVAVFTTSDDGEREKERVSLLHTLADGVLLVLPHAATGQVQQMERSGLAVVTVATFGTHHVWADSYYGVRAAIEHLVGLGHRRIGHVSGPVHVHVERSDSLERLQGYRDALEAAHCPFEPGLVADGDFTRDGGYSSGLALLSLPQRPSAIFAANDQSAFGVMDAARALGLRVPQDLSLVGFDDLPAATVTHPPLTTVRQPLQHIGERAMQMLLELMTNRKLEPRALILPTSLVVRETTARFEF